MTTNHAATEHLLTTAALRAGLNPMGAELIRDGSNVMYRLPGATVARIGRAGTADKARREVRTAQWLAESGVSVVQALTGVPQPVVVDDQPVTWWSQLPPHRAATPAELASLLRKVHNLRVPSDPALPHHDPFADVDERITQASNLGTDDRAWLKAHLHSLRKRYAESAPAKDDHVMHGDAWQGNVAVPDAGPPILLDLEAVAIGRRDWDLIQIAVDRTDFARLSAQDYQAFVDAYGGYDVTAVADYRTLADIQELRWACFALSKATLGEDAARETRHRLACIRGEVPRPWTWSAF